ncbi:MAG: hypothetical protein LM593_06120 [Candidatus Verstraetearchaeota archaeon]|nr:hypothetical protein [Candidatus Verstraetearchaeota archaeon]
MSASTISESILVLAAIILASGVSAYATYLTGILKNDMYQVVSDTKKIIELRIEIVYACINGSVFVVYAKNIGYLPITDYNLIDVYIGPYGSACLYTYSSSPSTGHFTITDVNGNNSWDPGETAIIIVYPNNIPQASVYEAIIKPLRGTGSSYLFPPPP